MLTLRIRESALDYLMHIAVKQVRFVGTSTLCEAGRSRGMSIYGAHSVHKDNGVYDIYNHLNYI